MRCRRINMSFQRPAAARSYYLSMAKKRYDGRVMSVCVLTVLNLITCTQKCESLITNVCTLGYIKYLNYANDSTDKKRI